MYTINIYIVNRSSVLLYIARSNTDSARVGRMFFFHEVREGTLAKLYIYLRGPVTFFTVFFYIVGVFNCIVGIQHDRILIPYKKFN